MTAKNGTLLTLLDSDLSSTRLGFLGTRALGLLHVPDLQKHTGNALANQHQHAVGALSSSEYAIYLNHCWFLS